MLNIQAVANLGRAGLVPGSVPDKFRGIHPWLVRVAYGRDVLIQQPPEVIHIRKQGLAVGTTVLVFTGSTQSFRYCRTQSCTRGSNHGLFQSTPPPAPVPHQFRQASPSRVHCRRRAGIAGGQIAEHSGRSESRPSGFGTRIGSRQIPWDSPHGLSGLPMGVMY